MHSNHVRDETELIKIENELGITGIIKHLKELGWNRYQWRYEEGLSEGSKEDIIAFKNRFKNSTHFAEFFSEKYNGMLRGNSKKSLREAVEKCLNKAQEYCACEQNTGHRYVPYKNKTVSKEYDNGLVMCENCGFNGYTNIIKDVERQIDTLENILNGKQELILNMTRSAKKIGLGFNMFGDILQRKSNKEYERFDRTTGKEIRKKLKNEKESNQSMIEILSSLIFTNQDKIEITEEFISTLYSNVENVLVKYAIGLNKYNFELVISNNKGIKEILKSDNFIIDNKLDFKKLNQLLKNKILKYKNLNNQMDIVFCENIIYNAFLLKQAKKELKILPKKYIKKIFLEE